MSQKQKRAKSEWRTSMLDLEDSLFLGHLRSFGFKQSFHFTAEDDDGRNQHFIFFLFGQSPMKSPWFCQLYEWKPKTSSWKKIHDSGLFDYYLKVMDMDCDMEPEDEEALAFLPHHIHHLYDELYLTIGGPDRLDIFDMQEMEQEEEETFEMWERLAKMFPEKNILHGKLRNEKKKEEKEEEEEEPHLLIVDLREEEKKKEKKEIIDLTEEEEKK